MKNKLCSALLLLALLIGLLNVPAWAASVLASGECGATGNDVTWTLERNVEDGVATGLLTIRGVGAMCDYASPDDVPWRSYQDKIDSLEVTIQSGVTSVGKNAFRECGKLEKVTLPDGLTKIGDVAFYDCVKLEEIALPDALETIGDNAIGYCALKEVTIPADVASIGECAFFKCAELTKIEVNPENQKYSSTDGVLFDKIAATEPTEPAESGEEGSEESAAPTQSLLIWYPANKSGEKYEIPNGITKIASYAFHSARNLTEVIAPDGLTEIGEWAFAYNPALKNLTLPSELTAVNDYAFYACTGLSDEKGNEIEGSTVTFKGSRQQWAAMKMGTGNYCLTNAKVIFEDMKQDNVIASGECGASGSNASWSLRRLDDEGKEHEMVISGSGAMRDYGSEASVPWTHYKGAEEGAEEQDLRDKITSVRVEGKLTNIGSYAFYNCDNLTTLTVETPSQLNAIGTYAFSDCAALTDMNLDKTPLRSINNYAFSDCAALKTIALPETLETIGNRAFLRSALTEITIPASVTDIGDWAFRWCTDLAAFTMEGLGKDAVTHYTAIGSYALADCAALENVSFTDNLTVIGDYALSACPKLTRVSIPASVSGIGSCAFYNCPAMTGVDVKAGNVSYSSEAIDMLMNSDQTCIFYYPMGRASDACAISESVTSVAAFAFEGATNLKEVRYGGSQTQWNNINIGEHNAPLLNATLNAEGFSSDDASTETVVTEFTIRKADNGWDALVRLQCGQYPEGQEVKNPSEAWCATYDKDGRFLGLVVISDGLTPGKENELAFTLSTDAKDAGSAEETEKSEEEQTPTFEISNQTTEIRLLIVDSDKSPCCSAETWSDENAA